MVEIIDDMVHGTRPYADDLKRIKRKFVGEKKKKECLFNLSSSLKRYEECKKSLERKNASFIRVVFKENGFPMNEKVTISEIKEGLWKISDQNHTYVVKDTCKQLEIYSGPGSQPEDMKKEREMEKKCVFRLKYERKKTLERYKDKSKSDIDSIVLLSTFKNNRYPLSDPKISRISTDTWEITDGNKLYEIKDIGNELFVYALKDKEKPDVVAVPPETKQLGGESTGAIPEVIEKKTETKKKCVFKLHYKRRKILEIYKDKSESNMDLRVLLSSFKNNRHPLSNPKISRISQDTWEITDGNKLYEIRDTGTELMVCQIEKYVFKLKYIMSAFLQKNYKSKNQKNIDSALLKGCFKRYNHHLSYDAKISRTSPDTWEITDGNKHYEIRDTGTELEVYQIIGGYGTKDEEEPDMVVSLETEQPSHKDKEIESWKKLCTAKDREVNGLKKEKKALTDKISELEKTTGSLLNELKKKDRSIERLVSKKGELKGKIKNLEKQIENTKASQEIDQEGLNKLITKVHAKNRFLDTYIIEVLIENAKKENNAEFINTLVKVLGEMLDDDEIKERLRKIRAIEYETPAKNKEITKLKRRIKKLEEDIKIEIESYEAEKTQLSKELKTRDKEISKLNKGIVNLEKELKHLQKKKGIAPEQINKKKLKQMVDKIHAENKFIDTRIIEILIEEVVKSNDGKITNEVISIVDGMLNDAEIKGRLRELRTQGFDEHPRI
ncbi:MAG: hypothetical protein A7315_02250 [Candidatus Altiarchaeales archaeon WOR_SM1_79]|nr:MAG: hypothetical protein A7315_02250 [Candidatus Altiarchaeales archaeon WOR_SM1_79]